MAVSLNDKCLMQTKLKTLPLSMSGVGIQLTVVAAKDRNLADVKWQQKGDIASDGFYSAKLPPR